MPRLRKLLYPIYRRLETTVHPLRYLFIEITQRCNLNCRHCGSDCGRDTQLDELSTDDWLEFFAYLGHRFDRRKLVLVITGGEPFCHPEFDRILAGLREHGLAWGMVTNGWALTPENINRALAAGISSITVSLDGLRASHDWLRGRKGSFERAARGIGLLARADLPFFDVVTCVNPRNLAELPQVLELLKKLGVPAWRLFSIFPKGRAAENQELLMTGGEFASMLDFIERQRENPLNEGISVQFSCEGYLPPGLDGRVRDEPYFCRAGISIGSVLCDGAISACPNISRDLVQGNIRKDDFVEVWDKRFGKYRDRRWMKTGDCASCADFARCKGNSMHLWNAEMNRTSLCTLQHLEQGRLENERE